jgi:hypothetical protein
MIEILILEFFCYKVRNPDFFYVHVVQIFNYIIIQILFLLNLKFFFLKMEPHTERERKKRNPTNKFHYKNEIFARVKKNYKIVFTTK